MHGGPELPMVGDGSPLASVAPELAGAAGAASPPGAGAWAGTGGGATGAQAQPPLLRGYVRALGPGLVTGASDDDPSGIATYSQAGATFGFGLLWMSFLTLPLMAGVQEICDRTALATGKGIGALVRENYGRAWRALTAVLLAALLVACTLNIAADLLAVGEGMQLLHAGPAVLWAIVAGGLVIAFLLTGSFTVVARVFKLATLSLLTYVVVLFFTRVRWSDVAAGTFFPHVTFSSSYLVLVVAVLGTTISPYLFFWQSLHRVEEMREEPEGGAVPRPLPERRAGAAARKQLLSRLDVFTGMTLSNLVMFAIIVATAATAGQGSKRTIESAAEAANALRPLAGSAASILFAAGFIGTGMLAVPVLAAAGAAGISEFAGKQSGFSRSLRRAPLFYALVTAGLLAGAGLSLLHVNPIRLLVVVAVVNGVVAAPLLVVVMRLAGDRSIMGDYVNGRLARVVGWGTAALMTAAALLLLTVGRAGGLY